MSSLKSILGTLCVGEVEGALIITSDGMVIESHLMEGFNAETLSAFMSQINMTIKNAITAMDYSEYTRYVIKTSQGRVYLVDLGKSVLIALADGGEDKSGKINVALYQAATEIKKTGRLDV